MTSGTSRMETFEGFRFAEERWCLLRGADVTGALTPLPAAAPASVTIEPLEAELTGMAVGVGAVVSALGDVNGDGIDDLIVGSGRSPNEGDAAYVYFGGASGPSTTPDITILGPSGAAGGYALVAGSAGDLNGDGLADFLVTARGVGGLLGRVYVFFGRGASPMPWMSGTTIDLSVGCAADLCFEGTDSGALLGWEATTVGDFDGDGIDDLALGAWRSMLGADGKAYIIRGCDGAPGSCTFTPGTAYEVPGDTGVEPEGWVVSGPATGVEDFGQSITSCGDLNGDGRAEVLISAPGSPSTAAGIIYRLDGRPYTGTGLISLARSAVTEVARGPAIYYGFTLECIGDYDGDGQRDVGVYSDTSNARGAVNVLLQSGGSYGRASEFVVLNDVASGANDDQMGFTIGQGWTRALGNLGILNQGSSRSALLFGSFGFGAMPGTAELFYGTTPPVNTSRSEASATFSPTTMESSGVRAAGLVGDVNGDGFNDVAVGDPQFMSGDGRVVVYY